MQAGKLTAKTTAMARNLIIFLPPNIFLKRILYLIQRLYALGFIVNLFVEKVPMGE
jgi:hypothetical protein